MTSDRTSKRRRRLLWVGLAVPVLAFLGLWIAGPEPVSMGPYVQNVTTTTADLCWFDEVPRRIEFRLDEGGAEPRRIVESAPASAHRLHVGDLRPDRRYPYQAVDAATGEVLARGSFQTAPATFDRPFSFAAVGDSGKVPRWFRLRRFGLGRLRGFFPDPGQWDVGRWMAAKRPDLFIHLGDVIYSHDQLPAYQEAFFRPFADQLAHGAAVVTLGNHDMHRWEHPEFFRVFHTPQPLDPDRGYRDFSHTFVWGSVRFLVLDSFWETWEEGPSRSWLEQTLAANRQPQTIVIVHSPAFSDEEGVTEHQAVQANLWPILVRHQVGLVISGDSHNYQRFRPIDGVTQVIVGTGGKSIRPVAGRRLAHQEERFGFLLVRVAGTEITGEFWAGEPQPLDRFTLR